MRVTSGNSDKNYFLPCQLFTSTSLSITGQPHSSFELFPAKNTWLCLLKWIIYIWKRQLVPNLVHGKIHLTFKPYRTFQASLLGINVTCGCSQGHSWVRLPGRCLLLPVWSWWISLGILKKQLEYSTAFFLLPNQRKRLSFLGAHF